MRWPWRKWHPTDDEIWLALEGEILRLERATEVHAHCERCHRCAGRMLIALLDGDL